MNADVIPPVVRVMRKTFFAGGVLFVACCAVGIFLWSNTHDDPRSFCKVRFGSMQRSDILIESTDSSLLIYRNGDVRSTPERYLISDASLADGVDIPSFEIENVTYKIFRCFEYYDETLPQRHAYMFHVKIKYDDFSYTQYCDVELVSDMDNLKIACFDGPLSVGPQTINFVPAKYKFEVGGKPTDVRVVIGTVDKQKGCWTMVSVHDNDQCSFPDDVRPVATIDFPVAGSATITKTYVLDQFC